jgi:kumamolisin
MQLKWVATSLVTAVTLLIGGVSTALAQTAALSGKPAVTKPKSSVVDHRAAGKLAFTNVEYLAFPQAPTGRPAATGPPSTFSGAFYQTPASIACIYDLVSPVSGCNPYTALTNPSGGSRAIAIVDAYDDPNATSDLSVFSTQFGVTQISSANFAVVYAPFGASTDGSCNGTTGTEPVPDPSGGWELEEALDIEMAHSMAPNAMLYLVEAQSNSLTDLYCAVTVASKLVNAAGGGEVSMSWLADEYPTETSDDQLVFSTPKIVYLAASGDYPAVFYPSTSPNVVSVGGTSLGVSFTTGNFTGESAWQLAGGGLSEYESRPSYQSGISRTVGSYRGTPDVSANGNPWTGVYVYDTWQMESEPQCDLSNGYYCWWVVGGTSVATPLWAGILNVAGSFSSSTSAELTKLYGDARSDFNLINSGSCGWYAGWFASSSWNFCTGLGSPRSYKGK